VRQQFLCRTVRGCRLCYSRVRGGYIGLQQEIQKIVRQLSPSGFAQNRCTVAIQRITPQLQEIIYRAMEREPRNRHPAANEFENDLEHQDQVGVAERAELRDWKKKKSQWPRRILNYALIALIPFIIFGLLLWVARHA